MTEHDGLDPWLRAALVDDELEAAPRFEQRRRMAERMAAAIGLPVATLLPGPPTGGGGSDGGGDGGGAGGDVPGSGAVGAAAGAGKAVTAIVGLIAGAVIGVTVSELRPRGEQEPAAIVDRAGSGSQVIAPPPDGGLVADSATADAPLDASVRAVTPPMHAIDAGVDAATVRQPAGDALARERQLLDIARAALRRGDLRLATKHAVEHALRYPSGFLAEEREVLAIELALARGDHAGALARAAAFRHDYPRSVFQSRVDELVR